MTQKTIRIGSRGSQLALWQANHIADKLRQQGHPIAITIIKTTGDRMQDAAFARTLSPEVDGKGLFTKEIEEALLAGTIDLAVHSLKDLPTELAPPFKIAAIPPRVDPRDALVASVYGSLAELPQGARIGTTSPRRQAQLRAQRKDLVFVEMRGNVDTRLRKLSEGQVEALVLAAAGLERLDRTEWIRHRFSASEICPAAGQGALAIECRADDAETQAALHFLDDVATRFAVTAERAALTALGGGCQTPIGAYCVPEGTGYRIHTAVAAPDGAKILRAETYAGRDESAEALGKSVADELLSQGAMALLGFPG
ncbi:MAG: hydroxymethylbilane synthase [Acidobacteriaceae bacterium]